MKKFGEHISNFAKQCLPFGEGGIHIRGNSTDSPPQGSSNGNSESAVKTFRRSLSSAYLSSAANLMASTETLMGSKLRNIRPPSRREQLMASVIIVCMFQIFWMRQYQETTAVSMLWWVRESIMETPDPGQPPTRRAYLPPIDVLKASPDPCAQALGIPRVALMFLTTGDLYHEETWRLWLESAAGVLPSQSVASSICQASQASSKLQRASKVCLQDTNSTSAINGTVAVQAVVDPAYDNSRVIDGQHLFSVYIHAPPSFRGYHRGSLWYGRLIQNRVQTSWGAHTLVEATRHLLWEAYRDPLNTRFILVSESDLPLYDPLTFYQQLQSETKSRLDTCKHQETSPWRWDPRMETSRMKFHHWRKSPQWMGMTREHVELALRDEEIFRKFERHCWSSWDEGNGRWHRDCFSDEHYFATLLSVEGKDAEGVCEARGVSYTEWEGRSAHPKAFGPNVIDADLFKRARQAPWSVSGQPLPNCDWNSAYQEAQKLFVKKSVALSNDSVDLCSRLWRQPPTFKAKMPESCFLTARKFPFESRDRIKEVFLQCGNGIELLRRDVCLRNGGVLCGTLWGRVKGLFARDPC